MARDEGSTARDEGSAARDERAAAEEAAWAGVLARWEDDAAHRAYLDGQADLPGLAIAGGRYRAVLAERPDDPIAARWREEIVKRATVQGLASLPRSQGPDRAYRGARRWLTVAAAVILAAAVASVTWRLLAGSAR